MLPLNFPFETAAFNPLVSLLIVLVLDAAAGEMPWLFQVVPHPVEALGKAIGVLEHKLNRPERGEDERRFRGLLMVAIFVGGAWGLGRIVETFVAEVNLAWPLYLLLATTMIAQRSLHDHVKAVADALETEGLAAGRDHVSRIVGRDPESLDQPGVCRAAIESLAENFSDGVVAPVFWFVLFGLPGLLAYKTVNTLDSMIGHRTEKFRSFGWAAAKLDDLANWIPARLAGLWLVLVTDDRRGAAWRTMLGYGHLHRSPNSGRPEAAMAGALGLKLGGPRVYPGERVTEPWMGEETEEAEVRHIRRALTLFVRACLVNALAVGLVWSFS